MIISISMVMGVVGIISGVIMLISGAGFVYLMLIGAKYSSRSEIDKFFGSHMLNNPKRYMFAFACLVIGAISLSIGFIVSFIASFFINPLVVWEIAATITIASLSAFLVAFTSIDNPKFFLDYLIFIKNKKNQSSLK